jgi:pilus assembly protein CpaE
MLPEMLKVSILFGTGNPDPAVLELVENIPQVQMVGQSTNPEEFLEHKQGLAADLVMVYTDGDDSLPEWLETLPTSLPHTAVLLCSESMDPEFLLKAMRLGVREVVSLPLDQEELEKALKRIRASKKRLLEMSGVSGKMLVITGNKGGVGATTVAVNLSLALSRVQAERVVLVDLGRPYPDVGNFLDRESMYTIFDLIQNQENLDHIFMEKIVQPYEKNLALVHGISDFHDQDNINLEGLKKVFSLLKSRYRWVVVDLSHWLDELFLQVVQDCDQVLMLLELSVPDLRNLGHLWPLLRNWDQVQEKVKLVVNRYDRSNGLSLSNLQQVIKQKAFFTLPSDYQHINEAINRGIPLVGVAPKSKLWSGLEELAHRLVGQFQPAEGAGEVKPRRRFWVF